MNIKVIMNGQDVTDACLLSATRIAYDSSKRITTAQVTVMGQALAATGAVYDAAHYDVDHYAVSLNDMYQVQILDGRDGVTKLFDGQIHAMTMQQSDAKPFSLYYQCELNDWAAWLDRSVCWDPTFALTMPNSDQGIILALLGQFCPKIHVATANIAQIVPVIQKFDWLTKTCRQVLDDLSSLSMGSWRVDFNANLHYQLPSAAPAAPFNLSTSPDYATTFPLKVDGYRHDFTNPVNHAYVRGTQDPATGVAIAADYKDPVSIQTYGEYATGVVDDQIVTGWDAALRAKSIVLTNAYPIESGNFTIWGKDGLACGMQIHLKEENIGIDGDYIIRALTMQWIDKANVVYTAQFGAAQPDLETILRLLDQRTKWKTSNVSTATPGPPPAGSVTDASIVAGGLSAAVINSVNAGTIQGQILAGQIQTVNANTIIGKVQADQIQGVNAGSIVGQVQANQIQFVNAVSIQGAIQANQIGAVNANVINGVIIGSQLADQIIDNLAKYATALTPIQMIKIGDPWPPSMPNKNFPPNSFFYYQPDGHFYQINSAGTAWAVNDNPKNTLMSFYYIGAINATSITGLILAAQINTITAGQITGAIQASQIGGVNASVIAGPITASQIQSVNAVSIQGQIQAGQIASIASNQISGTITAGQIGTITAGQITGTLAYTQIGSINASTITIGQLQDSQIAGMSGAKLNVGSVSMDKFPGYAIDVGGLNGLPGRIRVFDGAGTVVAQMGNMTEVGIAVWGGGWFKVWAAGGNNYGDAPIYTDTNGSLFIRNTNLTNANVSGGSLSNPSINVSGQIYTSPSTFDQTYSSLAWINSTGADQASFVSRGLVLYYNGGKIGSVVRAPGGGWMEIEFPTGGGYILLSGQQGIRSDAGYLVGGTRIINSSGQFTGTLTGTCTGTLTGTAAGPVSTNSSIFTSSSCTASSGYFGGSFQGSGVAVGGNGISCGSLQVSSGPITCGSITVNGAVNCVTLQINGVTAVSGNTVWQGSVQCTTSGGQVFCGPNGYFGIYGQYAGATLNSANYVTFQATNGTQYTFRVVGGLICS